MLCRTTMGNVRAGSNRLSVFIRDFPLVELTREDTNEKIIAYREKLRRPKRESHPDFPEQRWRPEWPEDVKRPAS